MNIVDAIYYIACGTSLLNYNKGGEFTKDGFLGTINISDLVILSRFNFEKNDLLYNCKAKIIINQNGEKRAEFNFARSMKENYTKLFSNKGSNDDKIEAIFIGAPKKSEKIFATIQANHALTKDEISDIKKTGKEVLGYILAKKY